MAQLSLQVGTESFVAHIVSSPYREKVIQAFKRHKTPLHMNIELPTLQAIKRFVAMGNGVALLPEISVENELARGELVRIPVRELRLHRKLRIVYRKAGISHAARAFLKVAEAVSLERGDDGAETGQLRFRKRLRFLQRGDLAVALDQHRAEHVGVIGQGRFDEHDRIESAFAHPVNRRSAAPSHGDRHARAASLTLPATHPAAPQ